MDRCGRRFFSIVAAVYSLNLGVVAKASDAGITPPPYESIVGELLALSHHYPGWATVSDYGTTPEGRPLRALRLAYPHRWASGRRPAVLMTGSTHGDEYLHIEDRLPAWFLRHRQDGSGVARFFAAGGVILLVPVVNPDGFAARTRHNSHDADINRDFAQPQRRIAGFDQPESRALAGWLAKEVNTGDLELRLTLDYHCCSGALLFPRSLRNHRARSPFLTIAKMMIQDIDPAYRYGPSQEILGYDAGGTSKDYYRETYGALAFTFEGRYGSEARHFPQHAQWWERVLALMVAGAA